MPEVKIDWDGDPVEIEEEPKDDLPEKTFSIISTLLICMIFVVVLVIAYINRRLLISKFKQNCLRQTKEIKKACAHEDSMIAASSSLNKMQESYQVNHEEIFLKNILEPVKFKQDLNDISKISNVYSVNSI